MPNTKLVKVVLLALVILFASFYQTASILPTSTPSECNSVTSGADGQPRPSDPGNEVYPLSSGVRKIEESLVSNASGTVRVIILFDRTVDSSSYGSLLGASADIKLIRTFRIIPAAVVEMPCNKMNEVAELSEVVRIYADRNVTVIPPIKANTTSGYVQPMLSESVSLINASLMWLEGYNGTGVMIAILDTGIDDTHPDLDDLDDDPATADPKVILEMSFTGEPPDDGYGHGTHCAGIAAGTGQASSGTYKGVAPGAYLINGKVLTNQGWGYYSWIIAGIEWAVQSGADVISMSLGGGGSPDDPLALACDAAVEAGVTMAIAAGNDGPRYFSISSPGVARKVITVGASDKNDVIAGFSSRGPSSDNRMDPDVVAPGVSITSCVPYGKFGHYYESWSGTSMATPHIAGAAALLMQALPTMTPEAVQAALMLSATDIGYDPNTQGMGRIDVYAAYNTAKNVTVAGLSLPVTSGVQTSPRTLRPYQIHATELFVTGPVAVFKDVDPWGYKTNEEMLEAHGISYNLFSSAEFGAVNLRVYKKVVIASDQPQSFYNALASYKTWFEDYVKTGGTLEIHACDMGWAGGHWSVMPGDLSHVNDYFEEVDILVPGHQVFNSPNIISDADLDYWNAASHGYFNGYPIGTTALIAKSGTALPVFIEFRFGGGTILASMQPLEWKGGDIRFLENVLLYQPFICQVLFDDSHDLDGDDLLGNYYELYLSLQTRGYKVTQLNASDGPITSTLLSNYSVLILPDIEISLSEAEISAITDFVTNHSGALLVLAEDPGEFNLASVNALLASFSIECRTTLLNGSVTLFAAHPVTDYISSFIYLNGTNLKPSAPAITVGLFEEDGHYYSVIAVYNETGKVVVVGDSSFLENEHLDKGELQLAFNIVNWFTNVTSSEVYVDVAVDEVILPYLEEGQTSSIEAVVSNQGEISRKDVVVQLLVDGILTDQATILNLPVSYSEPVALQWVPPQQGSYNITVNVVPVPDETVTENNVWIKMIRVDVVVKSIVVPYGIQPGETVRINATVSNVGDFNLSNVVVQLLVNGSLTDSYTIPYFAGGASQFLSLYWNVPAEGNYNLTVYIAPPEGETDILNNRLTKIIGVGPAPSLTVMFPPYVPTPPFPYTIPLGVSFSQVMTIIASRPLINGTLNLVGSAASMISVSNTNLGSLKGHGFVVLTFTIPSNATLGMYNGTLQLISNNTVISETYIEFEVVWSLYLDVRIYDFDVFDISGDLDGKVEAGEDGEIDMALINLGNDTARDTYGILTTEDPGVWIWDNYAYWGDIPNGSIVWAYWDDFNFYVYLGNLGGGVKFTLTIYCRNVVWETITFTETFVAPINEGVYVDVRTDKPWYTLNETVAITAAITNMTEPVLNATVTANITRPNGVVDGPLTLVDEEDGNYTCTYNLTPDMPMGEYKIHVLALIVNITAEGYGGFYVPSGALIVGVLNSYGKPAAYAAARLFWKYYWSSYYDYNWYRANKYGLVEIQSLAAGNYTIQAWSDWYYRYYGGEDNFILYEFNYTYTGEWNQFVCLDASTTPTVIINATGVDGNPLQDARVGFIPTEMLIDALGPYQPIYDLPGTDQNGILELKVSNGTHLTFLVDQNWGVPASYFLYQYVNFTEPTETVVYAPLIEELAVLNVSAQIQDYVAGAYIVVRLRELDTWYYFMACVNYYGAQLLCPVLITPGNYSTYNGLIIGTQAGDNWYYYFEGMYEPAPFEANSTYSYVMGGKLTLTFEVQGESFSPGAYVGYQWGLFDSYNNTVNSIYTYGGEGFPSTECQTEDGTRIVVFRTKNGTFAIPLYSWDQPKPHLTVTDPSGVKIVERPVEWYQRSEDFRLPFDATNGVYKAELSVDTGPWQNLIVVLDTFTVGEVPPTRDLADFPVPFVDIYGIVNVTFIVGGTHEHGTLNWRAWTVDVLGAIGVAGRLGLESQSGTFNQFVDTDIATYNATSYMVAVDWSEIPSSNVVSVGSSFVNIFTLAYERFGGAPFYMTWVGGQPAIHSDLTGENYTSGWGYDYAVIALFYDGSVNRHILLVYGVTGKGSQAACMIMQSYDVYRILLQGGAVIVRWNDTNGNGFVDLADSMTLIESN